MLVLVLFALALGGVVTGAAIATPEAEPVAPAIRVELCPVVAPALVTADGSVLAVNGKNMGVVCPKWEAPVKPTPKARHGTAGSSL